MENDFFSIVLLHDVKKYNSGSMEFINTDFHKGKNFDQVTLSVL